MFTELLENLGMRVRPLRPDAPDAPDKVVLDGIAASFVLREMDGPAAEGDVPEPYDLAWSANVPHHLEYRMRSGTSEGEILIRRWDEQRRHKISFAAVERDRGEGLIKTLDRLGPARGRSAIEFALQRFRMLRDALGLTTTASVGLVRAFHGILEGAAAASRDPAQRERFRSARTLEAALPEELHEGIEAPLRRTRIPLGLTDSFLRPDASTGRQLHPDILLRHAAGALYEEAHLEFERTALQQDLFVDDAPRKRRGRPAGLGIHYTPSGLARTIAEESLRLFFSEKVPADLRVLDPACGSGVFLVEFASLLEDRARSGDHPPLDVHFHGIDRSGEAAEMARLAFRAVAPHRADQLIVEAADSLAREWPEADVILMNPPFIAWEDLDSSQRQTVLEICGGVSAGRPDLATAFVTKALAAVKPNGVIATILPSSLLETRSGEKWREQLTERAQVAMVARFEGQDVFPSAMVEAAVLLLKRRDEPAVHEPTRFVLSHAGHAGEVSRWLHRTGPADIEESEGFEVYSEPRPELKEHGWMPRTQRGSKFLGELAAAGLPRVGSLFSVQQGIRSGADNVFLLSAEEFASYPPREQEWFRPLAGSRSIIRGRLLDTRFTFYPYEASGLALTNEKAVRAAVPQFWKQRLLPARTRLEARAGTPTPWWTLTRPREWLLAPRPRIVSTYFGWSGAFAFDEDGRFVVGQGFGWLMKRQPTWSVPTTRKDDPEGLIDDVTRSVGYAYAALFNSRVTDILLEQVSERVQGGQFDLSPRYVNFMPVPDLTAPTFDRDLLADLDAVGRAFASGERVASEGLDALVARAYGIALARWPLPRED